jgi:hypothetical protein
VISVRLLRLVGLLLSFASCAPSEVGGSGEAGVSAGTNRPQSLPQSAQVQSLVEVRQANCWIGHVVPGAQVEGRWLVRNLTENPVDIGSVDVRCRCGVIVSAEGGLATAAQAPGDLPRRAGAGVGSAAEGGAAADGGG